MSLDDEESLRFFAQNDKKRRVQNDRWILSVALFLMSWASKLDFARK